MNELALPQRLPELINRAGTRLLDAENSGEVLEAKAMAEAALHYAKLTKAANDTHADCLRIITRAEIRMADEIDRGREVGEVATHGGANVRSPDVATYDDLGISRQRVSEWRELRDAGEQAVESAIQDIINEGRTPTKSEITNNVRGTQGTGENEWYTPEKYIQLAKRVMGGIDLDPATNLAAQSVVNAARIYCKEDDGLKLDWAGRVWLNPPYAQPLIAQFIEKLVGSYDEGSVSDAILLTHNYTDTAWFHNAASVCSAMCFTSGRVRFVGSDGGLASPTQGQVFHYFGDNPDWFSEVFSEIGFAMVPHEF